MQPLTRLFISYSSKDLQLAEEIDDHLKAEGFDVWRDKREIETDWSKEIANALTSSDIILVIWTKNASTSRYVKNEWLTARALGKLIKPILFSKDKLNEELNYKKFRRVSTFVQYFIYKFCCVIDIIISRLRRKAIQR